MGKVFIGFREILEAGVGPWSAFEDSNLYTVHLD